MVAGRRSLQDRIRDRQKSGFVGRQGQVIQYHENLGFPIDDERRRFLFNIHGDAGVGKTYLTRQLEQIATGDGALAAYVDETAEDVTAAMAIIAEQFSRRGARLSEFDKRAAEYRQRRHELESDQHAPDGVAAFITKTAVTIGLAAARGVPVAGSLLAPVDAAIAADQVNQARAYLARKFSDHADVRLLLSPVDELTPVFVAGLNRVAAGRTVALFLDTYERTGAVLDHWLRGLYAGRYGDLPETLITTVSGQKPLNPNLWGDYLSVIADVPLEPFSEAEARQFLASKNITDEAMTEVILTLSGRLPLWLATLAEARPQDSVDIGDPAGDAVTRFLKWEEDPERRDIAVAAALPRVLNQDVLMEITSADKAPGLFGWLRGLPFVSQRAGTWTYHEVVRAAMLRLRRAEAPTQWRSNQMTLARANARWAAEVTAGAGGAWASSEWIDWTREETYHLLCADPIGNLPSALASAVKVAEKGVNRARQWAGLIGDAGRDTDNAVLRKWGQCLRDGIHDSDLTQYLTCLINDARLDDAILAIALKERGYGHQLARRDSQAIADFTRAIELQPADTWAFRHRGRTYWLTERLDEAVADFTRAIELDPADAWAFGPRGEIYRFMERYHEALADLNRAIELEPADAWTIAIRGQIHEDIERYDEALADFTRAIELDPANATAFGHRGQIYWLMERHDEALADLNRAVELEPADAWVTTVRGHTYRLMERYDEALADFTRAIELDHDYAWAIAERSRAYLATGRKDEALTDITYAIELEPADAWAFGHRGQIYWLMERHDEALADLNRAVELDHDYAWAIAERSRVHLATGRYDDALADITHAIELKPADAGAITFRGQIYGDMDRYEEALADFTRAIELDPANARAIADRGETHRLMERYDEALADFTRAVELEPADAWAIASRGQTYRAIGQHGEAVTDLSRAITLDPSYAWAFAERSRVHLATGRYDEALADITHAIELEPSDNDYDAEHAEIQRLLGNSDRALSGPSTDDAE